MKAADKITVNHAALHALGILGIQAGCGILTKREADMVAELARQLAKIAKPVQVKE